MNRRQFNKRFAAGAAATLTGLPEIAQANLDNRDIFPRFSHIRIKYGEEEYTPKRLFFVSHRLTETIRVNLKFRLSNENRSSALNPTLARQFRGGVDIGDVRLLNRDIIVNTNLSINAGELRLTDHEISFRINGEKLAEPYNGDIPFLGNIPIAGHLFRRKDDTETKRSLMVLIRPEILDYRE